MLLKLINKFLKQPLKLEMFVPCDENGNVLEEPEKYGWLQNVGSRNSYATEQECIDCETFHLAKQKVLFEGFEMSIEKNAIINNGKKIIRIHGNNTFSLNGKLIITIEDLLNTNTNTMSKEFKGTQGQWVLEKDGNKFVAQIKINGKRVLLGRFSNEIDASNAYQSKLKEIIN